MTTSETATFLMEPELCESAQAGEHNFIGKLAGVMTQAGLDVVYAPFGQEPKGRSMSHIKSPPDPMGLCFRRVYHYPFWQIEQSAERWAWDVAQSEFAPERSEADEAARFYTFWQKRLFSDACGNATREGFVYVPLQGKLTEHRPFQVCSPLEMVEHCLAHTLAPVIATLHPQERYSRAEIAALSRLEKQHDRLSVQTGGMQSLLMQCDYVVTQNSSVAFNGYFFGKPALLFRKTDFHHIAVQADPADIAAGFTAVGQSKPDYAAYVHWFWQKNSINAGRPDAEERIAARLRRFGWPV
ncbi:hypothetical protein OS189_05935 [Sulfitobacter sp. F26169L]|uniref:hypothetical protein n=1 Tax=Sulfitobacter sp. F26169L TaxID=2996015 RepID=UPI002260BECC|nr:hypothetical protein [Sulfitobacter sp. F26169L]MCX7565877.1 hypothetical protein [Sulfitobacter sp. F26169L]